MSEFDDFDEGGEGGDITPAPVDDESVQDAHGDDPTDSTTLPSGACLSCAAPLVGLYCVSCGQKQDDLRRSLFLLGRNFVEDTFSFDGRMWRTLGLLAISPGVVPTQFSHGRRSRFTPPVRLFLVVSFLFFLTIGFTNTLFVGLEVNFKDAETAAATNVPVTDDGLIIAQNTEEEGDRYCNFQGQLRFFVKERDLATDSERLDACITNTSDLVKTGLEADDIEIQIGEDEGHEAEVEQGQEIIDRVFSGLNWAVTDPRAFNDVFNDWLPRVMFFMTPVLALILTLFLRRNALIFDHMVLSLYLHAVGFVIVGGSLVLAQLGVPIVAFLAVIAAAVYYVAALKRAYGRGWVKTLWTGVGSGMLYMMILSVILMSIVSNIVWRAVA